MYFEYVKPVSVFIGRYQHETGLIEVQCHDSIAVGRKMSDNIGSLRRILFYYFILESPILQIG